jgi:hypothetical protein
MIIETSVTMSTMESPAPMASLKLAPSLDFLRSRFPTVFINERNHACSSSNSQSAGYLPSEEGLGGAPVDWLRPLAHT